MKLSPQYAFLLLVVWWINVDVSTSSNILMLPHPFVPSHMRLFYSLATQLLNQGHTVTVLRYKSLGMNDKSVVNPPPGCNVIDLVGHYSDPDFRKWVLDNIDAILWKEQEGYLDYIRFFLSDAPRLLTPCLELQARPELMYQLTHSNFSLAIVDPHTYPCSWITANQLDIPYVALTPSLSAVYFIDEGSATPTPFSYVPCLIDGQPDVMQFNGRVKNLIDHHLFSTTLFWKFTQVLVNMLTSWKKVSLAPAFTFYLDNLLFEYARPMTNTHHYLGLKDRVRQPKIDEMSDFINSPNSKGTIILSLSTLGNKEMMSAKMKQQFYESFRNLSDYRIIWRTANPPQSPIDGNIIYTKWFNQQNILAQPNTKLLITHGGIATVLEALGQGVPMLAMPMGMDHHGNIGHVVRQGAGRRFHKNQLNTRFLTDMIRGTLDDPRYERRAKGFAAMFDMDRGMLEKPLLWWTEYAARHGHQQSRIKAQGEMAPHWRYFHIDIIVVLLATVFSVSLVL